MKKRTDELYGLWEETREILTPVIAYWYLHVLDGASAFEDVRQIRCDIENVLYPVASQCFAIFAVGSITKVQVW